MKCNEQVSADLEKIIASIKERHEGALVLHKWLSENTSWLDAPASSYTKYHCCFPGGLITHSVSVTKTLFKLRRALYPEVSVESCAIVGLFHDAGKVGGVGAPMYIPQTNEWKRNKLGQIYEISDRATFLDVPTRSLSFIMKFIELTVEEIQAIRYHDGQYCDENHCVANKEQPLTRLLQMADSWSAGVIEK